MIGEIPVTRVLVVVGVTIHKEVAIEIIIEIIKEMKEMVRKSKITIINN